MEIRLLLLFLFSVSLANRCDKGDIQVKNGQSSIIKSMSGVLGLEVLVWPESGFEGISLEVEGQDGAQHTAFFPAEEHCFPPDDEWWWLHARMSEGYVAGNLSLGCWIGSCWRTCTMNNITINSYHKNLTLRAHGASKWIKERPQWPWICNFRYTSGSSEFKHSKCKVKDGGTSQPDTTPTATTELDNTPDQLVKIILHITMGMTAVAMVVVVEVVRVAWEVTCQRKSDKTHPLSSPAHEAVQQEYEMNVINYDSYQPGDNYTTTEQEDWYDTKDHVYESLENIFAISNNAPIQH